MKRIQAKSIVIIRNDDKFLFTVGHEETTGNDFYIPVGGKIEFGECSMDAAKREVWEETGRKISNLRLIDVIENLFTYNDIKGHEIVFIYRGDFKDPGRLTAGINDEGNVITFVWVSLEEIKNRSLIVYPERLFDIIERL